MLNKVVKYSLLYVFFLFPSLIVGKLLWTIFVDGKLYYCSDRTPFLDFIPPFVHTGQFGPTGDYFVVDEKIVWAVWFLFIGLILFIPYILAKKFNPLKKP